MITDNEPPPGLKIDLSLTFPKDEKPRGEPFDYAAFLERTRRYHRLTHQASGTVKYARGLDSKREEFA